MQGDAQPDRDPEASATLFHTFAVAGKKLADLHVNYESAAEYRLQRNENQDVPLNYRVEKMKLVGRVSPLRAASSESSDGAHGVTRPTFRLLCNEFLTLSGIPPAVFRYRLGSRSALNG